LGSRKALTPESKLKWLEADASPELIAEITKRLDAKILKNIEAVLL